MEISQIQFILVSASVTFRGINLSKNYNNGDTRPEANIFKFNYKIARVFTGLQLIEDAQNTSCKMIQNTLHVGNR